MRETEQGKAKQVITASQPLQIDESCVSLTDFYQPSELRKVQGQSTPGAKNPSLKSIPDPALHIAQALPS